MFRHPRRSFHGCAPHAVRIAVAALAVLLLPACSGEGSGPGTRARTAARVDSLVAAFQRETYAPGVSVAVIRGGRDTLVFRGYGMADLENDVPATPATVYRIGSLTKQFTAAAVLRLAERGRLSLDDPIGRHLPHLPDAWRGMRIHQLLNHTAGIPNVAVGPRDLSLVRSGLAPDSVLALMAKEPPDFAPGAEWRYSNAGYLVLGRLVERVSGQPYARYLETEVLRPLGLTATRYCDEEPLIRHRAAGYDAHDTVVVNAPHNSMTVPYAAGGLCSTVGDLAAWNRALALGRVVSPASWARMTTPEGAAQSAGYGFGIGVGSVEGRHIIRHGGGIEGFRTSNLYVPGDSLSVTVLTNLSSDDPDELIISILRAVLGEASTGDSERSAPAS